MTSNSSLLPSTLRSRFFFFQRVYMFNQEELIKEYLITINHGSFHFNFPDFSLFKMKMTLAYTNYNDCRVVMQNCLIHCNSKLCTNKFNLLFHVLYIVMESQSLFSTQVCITNTNDLIIETNTIEELMWCNALAGAKCCNRSYAISKLAKRLKWENEKKN